MEARNCLQPFSAFREMYKLGDRISGKRGGQTDAVYTAEEKSSGRRVFVKVITLEKAAESMLVERFEAINAVRCSFLVQRHGLYRQDNPDYRRIDPGSFLVVMEYINGQKYVYIYFVF